MVGYAVWIGGRMSPVAIAELVVICRGAATAAAAGSQFSAAILMSRRLSVSVHIATSVSVGPVYPPPQPTARRRRY